jgi:hypothetical protein
VLEYEAMSINNNAMDPLRGRVPAGLFLQILACRRERVMGREEEGEEKLM